MLSQQHAELEKLGFAIVHQSEDEIIGVRTKWFWDCFATQMTLVIFVRAVASLTATMIKEDTERMITRARSVDPSPLPIGIQKGRAVIAIYVADKVEADAQRLCSTSQKIRFATSFFPAALEQASGNAYYLHTTPIWGWVYFGKLRYLVQRLIDPANVSEKEPISAVGSILGIVLLGLVVCVCSLSIFLLILWTAQYLQ